jgi:hypothetical protein
MQSFFTLGTGTDLDASHATCCHLLLWWTACCSGHCFILNSIFIDVTVMVAREKKMLKISQDSSWKGDITKYEAEG